MKKKLNDYFVAVFCNLEWDSADFADDGMEITELTEGQTTSTAKFKRGY